MNVLSLSGNSGVNTIWAKTYGHTFELTRIDSLIGGHMCICIYYISALRTFLVDNLKKMLAYLVLTAFLSTSAQAWNWPSNAVNHTCAIQSRFESCQPDLIVDTCCSPVDGLVRPPPPSALTILTVLC